MFYSLTYSTLLISLDPYKEMQIYEKSDYIHPWYYIYNILKLCPNAFYYGSILDYLPGTRSQVIRMIKYIESYLKKANICPLTYIFDHMISYERIIATKLVYSYPRDNVNTIDFTFRKCCNPSFKITSKNWIDVLKILDHHFYLAELPWLIDIKKYMDLNSITFLHDFNLYLYANSKIDKESFITFISRFDHYLDIPYYHLCYRYIRNMFRFRMQKGMGIELHYPQYDESHEGIQEVIQEDTVEWRVKLYKLNTGLVTSGILNGYSDLINAIPGRHYEYINFNNLHHNDLYHYVDINMLPILLA